MRGQASSTARWVPASLETAHDHERGPHHACQLREWTHAFIANLNRKDLPKNIYGTWKIFTLKFLLNWLQARRRALLHGEYTWCVTSKVTSHDIVDYEWGLSYCNMYTSRDLLYLITPLATSIHNRYCTADVVPSFYMTMPDAAFLNYMLRLMRPFSYTVDLFTYITYFSFPNLRSYFHTMKV
jgi:hypothetical protein